jgi:hypothetical protein
MAQSGPAAHLSYRGDGRLKGARPDEYPVILFGPAGQRVWGKFKRTSQVG